MEMIKVSANSRTSAVAGAIAGVIREHKRANVQAIGAGAVNQAVKALVLATGYLRNDGIDICCVPEFVDVEIEDKVRTAIRMVVEPRVPASPSLPASKPEPTGMEMLEPEPMKPEQTEPDQMESDIS